MAASADSPTTTVSTNPIRERRKWPAGTRLVVEEAVEGMLSMRLGTPIEALLGVESAEELSTRKRAAR